MDALNKLTQSSRGAVARQIGTSPISPKMFGQQREVDAQIGRVMALPGRPLPPIQDNDPDSPSFGTFTYMVGYDELGSKKLG